QIRRPRFATFAGVAGPGGLVGHDWESARLPRRLSVSGNRPRKPMAHFSGRGGGASSACGCGPPPPLIASMDPPLLGRDLRKRSPARPKPVDAVNGLDLEVLQGECFGLLGPNGAGKTTTIEILEGLLPASAGEVRVLGHAWGQADDDLRQRLGISLQET